MALVTVRDLRIGFRGPALLDGVSCQIEPGQRIGLLGRNGAGKTTLHADPQRRRCSRTAARSCWRREPRCRCCRRRCRRTWRAASAKWSRRACRTAGDDHDTAWQAEQRVERMLTEMELAARSPLRDALLGHEAARAAGPGAGLAIPTCCCSTSRRTIWTWRRSSGSKTFSRAGRRR